jgi:hypothetical protein
MGDGISLIFFAIFAPIGPTTSIDLPGVLNEHHDFSYLKLKQEW